MKRFFFWKREPETPARRPAGGAPVAEGGGSNAADSSGLLTGDAREDLRSLEILLDTIAAVTANIDLDVVLNDIVDRSLLVTRAERAILLLGDVADALQVRVARDKDGNVLQGDLQYSRSLVRRCLEEDQA